MQARLSRLTLVVCLIVFAAFVYGLGVGAWQWPPFRSIVAVRTAWRQWRARPARGPEQSPASYVVPTSKLSFFKLDASGALAGPVPTEQEAEYRFQRNILPAETAVLVMDPWVDMPSEFLNRLNGQVLERSLLPAVRRALAAGHPVYILTNHPQRSAYSARIPEELTRLAKEGRAEVLYHDELNEPRFAARLRERGIHSLIYTGFHSNVCILGRPTGMVSMANQGFKLYFVPEASAGAEFGESWKDGSLHRATSMSISLSLAELIHLEDWMGAIKASESASPR